MSEGAAEGRWHLTGALITIAAITVWRLVCFGLTPLDLFMDEAQYWHWSRELALGYFSKPPLIGWVIRAVTELASAETAFWVRFAAPLGHAVAAVFIGFAARTIWDRPEAVWAGAAYATLPGVAVLSLFISTDDLLLPAFAVALFAWIKLRDAPSNVSVQPTEDG
ncbi:MAG: glycosyltransferase family 39 protein, partial [Pseudomonadota bacterium]